MNKIKNTLLILILFFSANSYAQPECSNFKVGKYFLSDPALDYEMVIERNDSIQIERNMTTGTESKYWIDWKNDCEYSLKIFMGTDDELEFYKDKLLYVKIVNTEKNHYIFEASIQGMDYKVKQVIYRFPNTL